MGPIGTHLRSFERYHPRPVRPPLLQDWGFTPHPKLQSLLYQERIKLRTSNLARTIIGSIRIKAHKNFWRKWSMGVSRDWPNFFEYPLLSQEREKLLISNLAIIFRGFIRTKAHLKLLRKGSVGVYRDCPIFSGTPYYLRNGNSYGF